MKTKACGFTQSTFVTTPLIFAVFFASYSASKEWCAVAGFTVRSSRLNVANPPIVLNFMVILMASADERRFCILLTEVFLDLLIRSPLDCPASAPGPRVRPWIVDRHIVLQRIQIRSRKAFNQMKR